MPDEGDKELEFSSYQCIWHSAGTGGDGGTLFLSQRHILPCGGGGNVHCDPQCQMERGVCSVLLVPRVW